MERLELRLRVNGAEHAVYASAGQTLLEVLRDDLELVGAREGCGLGLCGACTVLVEGRPISSCLTLAVQTQGKEITTVEGLAEGDHLHPVQQAFIEHAGFQCAYCTPGFILSSVSLLAEHPTPDDDSIREYLSGNLCRCGSYENILQAVRAASQQNRP